MNQSKPVQDKEADQGLERVFKLRGAIAFFVLLVLLGIIIWYGIYFLMLDRIPVNN